MDERSRCNLRCCVDGVSDSTCMSGNLRTDGQPDCSVSDCLQQSSPDSMIPRRFRLGTRLKMNVCSSSPDTGGNFPPDDDSKPGRGLPSIDDTSCCFALSTRINMITRHSGSTHFKSVSHLISAFCNSSNFAYCL